MDFSTIMVFSKTSIFSLWGKSYIEKIFWKKFFRKIFADLKNDAASEKTLKNRISNFYGVRMTPLKFLYI